MRLSHFASVVNVLMKLEDDGIGWLYCDKCQTVATCPKCGALFLDPRKSAKSESGPEAEFSFDAEMKRYQDYRWGRDGD